MHGEHGGRASLPAGLNAIGTDVFEASLRVHRVLGPGLLETVYEHCLAEELRLAGRTVARQVPVPVVYGSVRLEVGYRVDLLVDDSVVVEIKSVEALAPVHTAQVLTYLRFSGRRLGYLINFNTVLIKDGVRRLAL